jgi:bifunctional DNA-binding transcriptional regulator/antitoxin component of YhaV-PrlF toxin-antitoxin module
LSFFIELDPCRQGRNVTQPHALLYQSLLFIFIFGNIFAANVERSSAMERLIVDAEGKIIIPSEIIQRRGLHPGDELALVEVAEGLLVYQGSSDPETRAWWNNLSEEERHLAEAEARRYEALNGEEQGAVWKEGAESIEAARGSFQE